MSEQDIGRDSMGGLVPLSPKEIEHPKLLTHIAHLERELDEAKRQAAQMRAALALFLSQHSDLNCLCVRDAQRALSTDAGKGYVSVEKMREAIMYAMERHLSIPGTIEAALRKAMEETK